jgi:hypothetical protein
VIWIMNITFSCLENEWHAVPSFVLDINSKCTECRAPAVLGDGIIVQVSGLTTVKRFPILANNDVLGLDSWDSSQYANLRYVNDRLQ